MSATSTPDASVGRIADAVDAYVGRVIRARRRAAALTQDDLASACGISFQQVQKYENGSNRVSCSMLVRIAAALGASPAEFFPDPTRPVQGDAMGIVYEQLGQPGGETWAHGFLALDRPARELAFGMLDALVAASQARRAASRDAA